MTLFLAMVSDKRLDYVPVLSPNQQSTFYRNLAWKILSRIVLVTRAYPSLECHPSNETCKQKVVEVRFSVASIISNTRNAWS